MAPWNALHPGTYDQQRRGRGHQSGEEFKGWQLILFAITYINLERRNNREEQLKVHGRGQKEKEKKKIGMPARINIDIEEEETAMIVIVLN